MTTTVGALLVTVVALVFLLGAARAELVEHIHARVLGVTARGLAVASVAAMAGVVIVQVWR